MVKISSGAAYVVYSNSSPPAKFVFKSSRGAAEVVLETSSVTAFGGPNILVYIYIYICIHFFLLGGK